ncbi:MAG TPA: AGE family epimerase/isomerase [Paludibacter sp.]|nr:AGE family epimerase/isomerase [Paludibacter sp.]
MQYNLLQLKQQVRDELTRNILPFWMTKMLDNQNCGFHGQMTGENQLVPDAPKGGILNARILWTFSSAALHLKSAEYLAMATRAKDYVFTHFFDGSNGGTYWLLNADGTPGDTKKQIYSQAFFVYALVEYYRASGDENALYKSIDLFFLIEKHSFDKEKNGYLEAYSRDWHLLEDLRLSEKDANEKKTMNTHLHILEAYTNLYRVWKHPLLESQLKNLVELFLDRIINNETGHLDLFFDEGWTCKSAIHSYGHDIETSWLLDEAARVLGNAPLYQRVKEACVRLAMAASEGLRDDGGLMNERNCADNHLDTNCDWWPQAEAMVGYYNIYQLTGNAFYLGEVLKCWDFIQKHIIDSENGEWFWSVASDGAPDRKNDKAGFWKCPYHNGRMCLELIARINE